MTIESADNSTGSVARPLCVDLDGTLIATDATVESIIAYLKSQPLAALGQLPLWGVQGREILKRRLCERVLFDPAALPYRPEVVEYIREQKAAGRRVILATASDKSIAESVAKHLGLFDDWIGSDEAVNTKGMNKVVAIEKLLGHRDFDYIGDAAADLPIWKETGRAFVVNPSRRLRDKVQAEFTSRHEIVGPSNTLLAAIAAMRPHQWVKNVLLAVPMLTAHQVNGANLWYVAAAFVAFSLCASAVYVVNDIFDAAADRLHPRKCRRPVANGTLPIRNALFLAAILLVIGLGVAITLVSGQFTAVLLIYLALTSAYSLALKQMLFVDVLTLAGLYTLRLFAGGVATELPEAISQWLFVFSMFLFLGLAIAKRYTELLDLKTRRRQRAAGRGYRIDDLDVLGVLGPVSSYLAVLVFALYVNSPKVRLLYGDSAEMLLLVCPVLIYWISRIWLLAFRGKLHHDPVVFAATDRQSYIAALLTLLVFLVSK